MSQRAQDVILAADNRPFPSQKAAAKHADATKLDPEVYAIIPQDDGFVLARKDSGIYQTFAKLGDDRKAPPVQSGKSGERYYWVRFHAKSNPSDTAHVELSVNCETLIMQRERDVVLPERFVRHCQTCRYPDERQVPGQPRKVVGWIQTYPFSILREGTYDEFKRQRKEGTEKTMKSFQVDESAPGFDGAAPRQDLLDVMQPA